jgi:multidrug efflux pump subunit AcrB
LLVDNATVVCDNTKRLLNQGLSPEEAAIQGPTQVSSSLLMGSLTTISVFIPMTFALKGGTREYVFSLPVVVSLTLLLSWISALTVTAIMNRHLLVPTEGPLPFVKIFNWIWQRLPIRKGAVDSSASDQDKTHWYVRACSVAIQNRFVTIGVAFGLLFGSLMLPIKSSFFPDADRPQFVVDIYLPEGSPLHRTDDVAKRVEQIVRRLSTTTWEEGKLTAITDKKGEPAPRMDNMAIYVGAGGPRFYTGLDQKSNASNYSIIWVNTTDARQNKQYIADIRRAAWEGIGQPGEEDYIPPIAGARIVPKPLVLGTPVPSPIEYRLMGPRLASEKVLRYYNQRLKDVLRSSGIVWDVHDSWGEPGDQLDVDIKVAAANMAGVTNETVAQTLNAYFSGHYLSTYREGDHQVPIMLRLPAEQRRSLAALSGAYVEGYSGKVPLDSVARLELKRRPVKTTRFQAERVLSVLARPEFGILARDALAQLKPKVDEIAAELPPGYRIENGGIDEEATRGERQNAASLGIGGALILLCLVIQYNSWVKPLMIILTVPLAIIGGMLGLWIRGIPMGFMETLGFLALFGTVLNAAILMIDFAEQLITEKLAKGEGLAAPGEKSYSGLTREAFRECLTDTGRIRMMPILMTTLTTVGGLITLMYAGPLFRGLATVFAVGLALGTAITLFVLPAIMALMVENFGLKLGQEPEGQAEST